MEFTDGGFLIGKSTTALAVTFEELGKNWEHTISVACLELLSCHALFYYIYHICREKALVAYALIFEAFINIYMMLSW